MWDMFIYKVSEKEKRMWMSNATSGYASSQGSFLHLLILVVGNLSSKCQEVCGEMGCTQVKELGQIVRVEEVVYTYLFSWLSNVWI